LRFPLIETIPQPVITKILYVFTRTPLHVGAGASVGAIDQPVQRERHTGFPIIPGSSLKGSFADQWNDTLETEGAGEKTKRVRGASTSAWLFGSDNPNHAFAGALNFSEARVLAFPIRSAKGSYGWITCPLMLQRAKRDGVIFSAIPAEPKDDQAVFKSDGPLSLPENRIVLEEYCFKHKEGYPSDVASELARLVADELFQSITERLVVLSNGMMSHFAATACEVAQHVRISDETGTAEGTGLFNQENVPADTLFYSILSATAGRGAAFKEKQPEDALREFAAKVSASKNVFQFGGDASTGLGFTSVTIQN
jgi:CRISPR-associated protein Cmr4